MRLRRNMIEETKRKEEGVDRKTRRRRRRKGKSMFVEACQERGGCKRKDGRGEREERILFRSDIRFPED